MKKEKININLATIDYLHRHKKEVELLLEESLINSFSEIEIKNYNVNVIYLELINYVKNNKAKVYIAKIDYLVGFIWFFKIKPKKIHINYLSTHPAFQRQGIGVKLLTELHTYAKKHGIEEIELYVSKNNLKATLFYQKLGYKFGEKFNNEREMMIKKIEC